MPGRQSLATLLGAPFDTWDDLRAGSIARRFDVLVTMPAFGKGTPSINAASRERVDLASTTTVTANATHKHEACTNNANGSCQMSRLISSAMRVASAGAAGSSAANSK